MKKKCIVSLQYVGAALILPAIYLIARSNEVIFAFIYYYKQEGVPRKALRKPVHLIKTGIFEVVRHPLYTGLIILTLSLMLIIQSPFSTILGISIIFGIWKATKEEDKYNLAKFGSAYKEYMEEVPGWNIFLGIKRLLKKKFLTKAN
jgi:protein-S-isoprenylcysteine O-methyltransferase Ste14